MSHRTITALEDFLRPHVALGKSRLETLCLLIVGIVSARTVNLGHVACERGGSVRTASTYRRLQRFFQHARLGEDWALPLVAGLVGPARRWTLVLDRTNWSIGSREVNYLVLAVVTRRFRVPLLWTVLPGKGNSATDARIALIRRYLAHFPASTIGILLADREFVGADWLEFLNDNNIPFSIRLRENRFGEGEPPVRPRGHRGRLRAHPLRPPAPDAADPHLPRPPLVGARGRDHFRLRRQAPPRRLADRRLQPPASARPRRLPPPMGDRVHVRRRQDPRPQHRGHPPHLPPQARPIVAIALTWAGRAAADLLGNREPERKSHGYLARSYFRIGLDHIRNLLRSDPVSATGSWGNLTPKAQKSRGSRVV